MYASQRIKKSFSQRRGKEEKKESHEDRTVHRELTQNYGYSIVRSTSCGVWDVAILQSTPELIMYYFVVRLLQNIRLHGSVIGDGKWR